MKARKSFLAAWYLDSFFHELVPIYPLYAVMFGEFGVSPFQLSVLLAIWAAWALLAEIPSGALADKYSERSMNLSGRFSRRGHFRGR